MNILVTNDDGYQADGLKVLVKELSKQHTVYVIAPDGNRSGASHSITMYRDHIIKKIEENVWSYTGNPVDCVIVGLKSNLLSEPIDLIVSGINHGANMGTDIIYSGTASAAREGALHNIPSIAVSLDKDNAVSKDFELLSQNVVANIDTFIELTKKTKNRCFINVNAPSCPTYKGIKIASYLNCRGYSDFIQIEKHGEDMKAVFMPGDLTSSTELDSDYMLTQQGYISVALVNADPSAIQLVDGDTVFIVK
ncbi:MAG: 5'/3'-nucleotidase SurE [Treponema sp.]|nr:5'/3'-nucleotidase SurE [Treponema sp.]